MTEKLKKGNVRAGIFAGVFGLVCILITMFFCYLFTIMVPDMMTIALIIVAVLTMWMVFAGTYLILDTNTKVSEK
jgi:preprotein translocase subunit SecD